MTVLWLWGGMPRVQHAQKVVDPTSEIYAYGRFALNRTYVETCAGHVANSKLWSLLASRFSPFVPPQLARLRVGARTGRPDGGMRTRSAHAAD